VAALMWLCAGDSGGGTGTGCSPPGSRPPGQV